MRLKLGQSLDEIKASAKSKIDTEAEAVRASFRTQGEGQAIEYAATEADARAFIKQLNASLTNYPFLKAEVDAVSGASGSAPDPYDVARGIIMRANAYLALCASVKLLRRQAKLAIDAATTVDEVRAVANVNWPSPN